MLANTCRVQRAGSAYSGGRGQLNRESSMCPLPQAHLWGELYGVVVSAPASFGWHQLQALKVRPWWRGQESTESSTHSCLPATLETVVCLLESPAYALSLAATTWHDILPGRKVASRLCRGAFEHMCARCPLCRPLQSAFWEAELPLLRVITDSAATAMAYGLKFKGGQARSSGPGVLPLSWSAWQALACGPRGASARQPSSCRGRTGARFPPPLES